MVVEVSVADPQVRCLLFGLRGAEVGGVNRARTSLGGRTDRGGWEEAEIVQDLAGEVKLANLQPAGVSLVRGREAMESTRGIHRGLSRGSFQMSREMHGRKEQPKQRKARLERMSSVDSKEGEMINGDRRD